MLPSFQQNEALEQESTGVSTTVSLPCFQLLSASWIEKGQYLYQKNTMYFSLSWFKARTPIHHTEAGIAFPTESQFTQCSILRYIMYMFILRV